MDSVVLLHLLHTLAPRFNWRLTVLHVHHGISPNADGWAKFCSDLCTRYELELHIEHVNIAPLRADLGIEAAARKLRQAAFARHSCDYAALAHHADDQAETLLLQLLRGSGIKGVAAMPLLKADATEGPAILRPLLDSSRHSLLDYAQQHDLQWVEDESNTDESYSRNFIRHRLLPLLECRFPAYRETLSRSAQHFAEAGEILEEVARQDAQDCLSDNTLAVSRLRSLSRPRAKNLLRYFLSIRQASMPHAAQLDDLLNQLCEAREDAAVCVEFGESQVRRYLDKAYVLSSPVQCDDDPVLAWNGETELKWPLLNMVITFIHMQGKGISISKLQRAPVTLRVRGGSEFLRPAPHSATRSLKNLLQEHKVPPWMRERIPLLYCGEELVSVLGVVIASAYQATENEKGVLVSLE